MAKSQTRHSTEKQDPRGRASAGRVATIMMGRGGDGFIRDENRDLFSFNRGDVLDGAFNDLEVDDAVTFEVIADCWDLHHACEQRQSRRSSCLDV